MHQQEAHSKHKRMKTDKSCPNPLFEEWITEWRNEAARKNWKTKYVYDKALKSLRKYPLSLKSGKEAKLLEYFGDKICEMLDKKLSEYNAEIGNDDPKCMMTSDKNEIIQSSACTQSMNKKQTLNAEGKDKLGKQYIPARNSGPYALLITLYKYQSMDDYLGYMKKSELMAAAQPLCEKSFTIPDPGSHYTSWSSMGTIIKKGLVKKDGNPARYSLTDSGFELAEKILIGEEKQSNNSNSQEETAVRKYPSQSISSNQMSITSMPVSESTQIPASALELFVANKFKLEPGQFEILLCVDNCETVSGGTNERKLAVQKELRKNGINFDVRKLHVGDFLWIAREKVLPVPGQLHLPPARELVLDYIVERKRKDDLASSIKDGRFKEQKFRLKTCGLKYPIYLVEDFGSKNHLSLPESSLLQAVSNTQIIDGFTIKHTKDQNESVAYLTIMTRYLQSYFSNKTLWSCMQGEENALRTAPLDSREIALFSFDEFNRNSMKNKPFTVTELFGKQLLKVHGVSVDKAKAIIDHFPTPTNLITALNSCGSNDEKENLLSTIKFGKSGRNIGPALSKVLCQFYTRPTFP